MTIYGFREHSFKHSISVYSVISWKVNVLISLVSETLIWQIDRLKSKKGYRVRPQLYISVFKDKVHGRHNEIQAATFWHSSNNTGNKEVFWHQEFRREFSVCRNVRSQTQQQDSSWHGDLKDPLVWGKWWNVHFYQVLWLQAVSCPTACLQLGKDLMPPGHILWRKGQLHFHQQAADETKVCSGLSAKVAYR